MLTLLDALTLELFFVVSLIGFLVLSNWSHRRPCRRAGDGDSWWLIGLALVSLLRGERTYPVQLSRGADLMVSEPSPDVPGSRRSLSHSTACRLHCPHGHRARLRREHVFSGVRCV